MKYLEYTRREIDLRTEIITEIKSLVPYVIHGVLCFENIAFRDHPNPMVEQLFQWGITTSDKKSHSYESINIDVLITILRNLELHPPQE